LDLGRLLNEFVQRDVSHFHVTLFQHQLMDAAITPALPAHPRDLSEYVPHDLAINIGQAKVSTGVSIRQLGVVDSHLVQHRRVQVMD
jgi:hypothetical protein